MSAPFTPLLEGVSERSERGVWIQDPGGQAPSVEPALANQPDARSLRLLTPLDGWFDLLPFRAVRFFS